MYQKVDLLTGLFDTLFELLHLSKDTKLRASCAIKPIGGKSLCASFQNNSINTEKE
jgi:hypothetical protein